MTEPEGRGASRSRERPGHMALSAPPASYTAAVERYLTGAGIAKPSARIHRISPTM
ncbi:hypothetical protein [Streptomyces sp. NPDC001985]|uniref:hypothetical protein n=1 Tax=Streptomyces sp. NPDC001985 TaxID=3154406 RepID=UPI003329C785